MAKEVEDFMSSLRDQMSLLSDLVEMLKGECTKAYRNGVGFLVSSLKT